MFFQWFSKTAAKDLSKGKLTASSSLVELLLNGGGSGWPMVTTGHVQVLGCPWK